MPRFEKYSGKYLPVDEFAAHPLLQQINWTARYLVTMIRSDLMHGYYDTSLKVWMTTKDEVRQVLRVRNESVNRRKIDLDDF